MSTASHPVKSYTQPWTPKQLKHLLRRTLFGVTEKDIDFFKGKSSQQCIQHLLRPLPLPLPPAFRTKNDPVAPAGTSFVLYPYDPEREEDWNIYIRAQWVELMLHSQQSIREKMVLFWHNHFVIQFNTVKDSRYAFQYINTIRKHATGNFKTLLREITTSPGMLVYLNGNQNSKTTPNENYGRELQELFTIGKGTNSHYTEADVKAAAKVLTGWKDDKVKINSYFDPTNHNTNGKTFSAFYNNHTIKGKSGMDGAKETDELIDMLCANPEVSKFLCRKLYRWFVHSHIDAQVEEKVIEPLAEIMRQANFEIKPVLTALFSSAFFYDEKLIGAMFKSPTDYFIGMIRELQIEICLHADIQQLGGLLLIFDGALQQMGQYLGDPPSVAGWPAFYEFPSYDRNWVNSELLSARSNWVKDTLYFKGLNQLPNPYLRFNFLNFAGSFAQPNQASTLITNVLNQLCTVPTDSLHIAYLQNLLAGDKANPQSWQQLWEAYKSQPTDKTTQQELNRRAQQFFTAILLLPEYQIM